jgi:diguanylate cyclase (GGDEF)-like protein/PAS domain S-box-containing protein
MNAEGKTGEGLIGEVEELRRRVFELERLLENHERSQQALFESEERFRFMAETTGDVLYRLRYSTMKYDYISPSIKKLTGHAPEEIDELGFASLIAEMEMPGVETTSFEAIAKTRRAGKTGEFHADYMVRTKSGDRKWLSDHSFPWRNEAGDIIGSVGILTDITQRKQAEFALRRANHELQRLASLDGLTRLANRRRFDEFLKQEWLRMRREKAPLSVVLADIDHFKLYNDTFGHIAGDDCLRTVARVIRQCVRRPADLVARYGGEEFGIVLSKTDSSGAMFVSEMIRVAVLNLKISNPASSAKPFVTLSLGVSSTHPAKKTAPETLLATADEALYDAKGQGRNRAVVKPFP